MATSGTTSFSVTELDIITDAYENAGIYGSGETLGAEDVALARRKLNMIVKQLTGQIDYAPGLKMWCRRRAYLFLQDGQIQYSMGPTGDNIADGSYVTTTLTASASLGASTVTVASITGLATAMYVGIILSTGAIQWTTINGAPSGSTVTLTATLTAAADSGARLFAYTSKARRPFEITTAVRRDTSGNDTEIDTTTLLEEYEAISSKSAEGTPGAIYFEAQRTNAQIYLDCAPSDLTDVIRMVYLSYVEDSTAITDDIDFPAEWYRPLSAQLAIDLCPAFQRPVTQDMRVARDEAMRIAQNAHPATTTASFDSAGDCYD